MDLVPGFVAVLVSVLSLVVSLSRKNDRKIEAELQARDALGKKYAELAWSYSKVQRESSDPEKARKHAEQAFVLADTSADGKRDFNDTQMRVYLDAAK
jgi:hypothetical protein